jgi:hypothetical protein
MFKPKAQMDKTLQSHLRYPQNLLSVEATMFGKYHLPQSQALNFFNQSASWQVSLTGTGDSATVVQPEYQLLQLPGQSTPQFNAFVPLVPSGSGRAQNLTSFLVADCSWSNYGQLTAYDVPAGSTVAGPAIANAQIDANPTVSQEETLLGQVHSGVVFGPTLLIPIDDSLVYARALFVVSSNNAIPQLGFVVVYYGTSVGVSSPGDPTLLGKKGALTAVIGPSIVSVGSTGPTNLPATITAEIKTADSLQAAALKAVKDLDFATFGKDENQLKRLLSEINVQLAKLDAKKGSSTTGSGTPPVTSTTAPKTTSTTGGSAVTSTSAAGA